jgi:hypothetical protein
VSIKLPCEADVVRAVLDYLTHVRRWPCWRNNTGARKIGRHFVRWGLVGSGDVFAVKPPDGLFVSVECKRPGGKQTPAQVAFAGMVRRAGGVALVADSVGSLETQLRDLGIL